MERPHILHLLTPGRQASPFDVNMAADAGYQIITPYTDVALDAVTALTQDAIFSRGPKGVARTGIFIGGRDALLAADMLERAKAAMFKPFVVSLMADQKSVTAKGGTMRLGAYACSLKAGSVAAKVYGKTEISERHRHRFEVNNEYRARMEAAGLVMSGTNPQLNLVEMIELADHPYFVGCQFHPEFQSKPFSPHPLFTGFIKAALEQQRRKGTSVPPPVAQAGAETKAAEKSVEVPPGTPIARA